MNYRVVLIACALPGALWAQSAPGAQPQPPPSAANAAAAFAVRPPDEGSPFFAEREAAKFLLSTTGKERAAQTVAVYPRARDSKDTVVAMFTGFFTEMFASVKVGPLKGEPTTEELTIEPKVFSLKDRRDVDATYSVRNNTGKLIRLDFQTTQRFDLVTKDATGAVIERWSDDRAFQPQEGIIIINPKERIEVTEPIPTRDMNAGENYSIEADTPGYPAYSTSRAITPAP